ncbi:polypyrimidine tract-binding protein homolog 1-like isoform X1 [Telopea speciosissima]|uniref:polypyrimidine tract-binding protein homolog 1-like isoform X1 n=2 Tax=Telopea speciosissima TaxID=54955 RepID=UPI001CC5B4CD|nr:polypyrimidine tract-binding protein homolog 1-like isoform X1 [Telopea speciosissima]
MSVSGQPQFRYAQPPSKVLHLRNLPWECTEEELIELGKSFGEVVNTKCNVGPNRNQAFIEFADLNQAITMVSYYATSSEPAQVRGKTVYLQYSNRQEIVNNRTAGDVAGNVLLVTIEGVEAHDVSIDVLHLVFSAFGFVHKIATFEKTAGFQALVQFSNSETASAAKNALDGRSIPSYLLPDHVGPCTLRINFSAHTDLNVKFQSHRSRDYTNPYLPVAPSAIDSSGQFIVGLNGKKQEPESNVLLATIEKMQCAVNVDILYMVFSACGPVQKIAMFEKNAGCQALIQYPDVQTAIAAKEALEGHSIYDGGFCKLHLSYSHHTDLNVKVNNDRSRDYTIPGTAIYSTPPSVLGQQPVQMVFPAATQYNGNQFAPAADGIMGARPLAGWAPAIASIPQPVPNHLSNNTYMLPAVLPPEMGLGATQFQSGQPSVTVLHYGQ